MIKEHDPNPSPFIPRIAELRSSGGRSVSEAIDSVDLLIDQHLSAMSTYEKVNVNMEWASFLTKVKP